MRKNNKRLRQTCVSRSGTVLSLRENGREFVLEVSGGRRPDVVHVDEDPYTKLLACRCDYAVEVFHDDPRRAFFFVELKGDDVVRAAEQLAYTAEHLCDYRNLMDYGRYAKRYAFIVASHGTKPSILTRYQVCEARMKRCGFVYMKCKTRKVSVKLNENDELTWC